MTDIDYLILRWVWKGGPAMSCKQSQATQRNIHLEHFLETSCILSKHTIVLSHLYVLIRRLLHGPFIVTFRSREKIGRCGLVAATKQLASCGSNESPRQRADNHNASALQSVLRVFFCVCSFAYCRCNTGHVYEAVVLPRNPPTTLPSCPPSLPPSSPLGASRSVRPPAAVSPSRRAFTTEMAAKVSRSVLLLSRSSGTVAGSLPALVVSSQRHHQHIRPVSPRTYVCAQGRGRE